MNERKHYAGVGNVKTVMVEGGDALVRARCRWRALRAVVDV